MEVKVFEKNDVRLEEFTKNSEWGSVSQSWGWGELQKKVPSRGKIWMVGILDGEKILGSCLFVRHNLGKRGCWIYAHRGPVCDFEGGGV